MILILATNQPAARQYNVNLFAPYCFSHVRYGCVDFSNQFWGTSFSFFIGKCIPSLCLGHFESILSHCSYVCRSEVFVSLFHWKLLSDCVFLHRFSLKCVGLCLRNAESVPLPGEKTLIWTHGEFLPCREVRIWEGLEHVILQGFECSFRFPLPLQPIP